MNSQNLGSNPSSTISKNPPSKLQINLLFIIGFCTPPQSEDGRVVKAKVLRSFGAIRVGSNPTPRISPFLNGSYRYGLGVRIAAFHAVGPGSSPGIGIAGVCACLNTDNNKHTAPWCSARSIVAQGESAWLISNISSTPGGPSIETMRCYFGPMV